MIWRTEALNASEVGAARKPVGFGTKAAMSAVSDAGNGMMVSVGPPFSHATTGRPHIMPSTGPIPKCSFVGV